MGGAIVDIVKKLVTRKISVSQLSGPVGITRMSVEAARSGLESLLTLIALLSVNVAILNMTFDAINRAYQVVIAADAVAGTPVSYGEQVLQNTLRLLATITTTDDVISAWKQ